MSIFLKVWVNLIWKHSRWTFLFTYIFSVVINIFAIRFHWLSCAAFTSSTWAGHKTNMQTHRHLSVSSLVAITGFMQGNQTLHHDGLLSCYANTTNPSSICNNHRGFLINDWGIIMLSPFTISRGSKKANWLSLTPLIICRAFRTTWSRPNHWAELYEADVHRV